MELSEDTLLRRYVDHLGSDFGEYYYYLNQSVFGLVGIWDVYRAFFGTNEERVELLNRASGFVALTIQDSLHERVILGICQMTDPSASQGRKNLTLQALPPYIADPNRRDEVSALVAQAVSATGFARDLRNKLIAHSDFSAAVGSYQVDYSSIERIVLAIKSIIAPLRYIHLHYFDSAQMYHATRPLPDETGFLRCIYSGISRQEVQQNSREARMTLPMKFPDWLQDTEPKEFDAEYYWSSK